MEIGNSKLIELIKKNEILKKNELLLKGSKSFTALARKNSNYKLLSPINSKANDKRLFTNKKSSFYRSQSAVENQKRAN